MILSIIALLTSITALIINLFFRIKVRAQEKIKTPGFDSSIHETIKGHQTNPLYAQLAKMDIPEIFRHIQNNIKANVTFYDILRDIDTAKRHWEGIENKNNGSWARSAEFGFIILQGKNDTDLGLFYSIAGDL